MTRPPHDPARLYDRTFAFLFASQVCFVLANAMLAHYARWITLLGGAVRDVGLIMGVGAVAGLTLRPWLGQWINRVGPVRMLALGYTVFATGALGNYLIEDVGWPIYVLRALMTLGPAVVFASSLTFISQTAPVERRTEAIGSLGAAGFVGMLVGPYMGDVLLGSGERSRGDFELLFAVAAGALVLPAVLLTTLRSRSKSRTAPARLGEFLRTIRRHWPGSILLVNVSFGVCMTVPFGFLADFVDVAELNVPGASEVGLFFLGYAGWGIFVRLSLRRLPDRVGRRRVLLAGVTCMGGGMFSFLLVSAENPLLLIVPGLICGTGHALTFHTMTALSLESFPIPVRGTGSALALMAMDVGMIGGAPILGHLAALWGYPTLFVTIGSCCLVTVAIYTGFSVPVWRARAAARRAEGQNAG